MKISVIIPIYNECSTIKILVDRIKAVPLEKEIIIVDDGSLADTKRVLQKIKAENPEINLITHKRNMGKGASVRTALKYASGNYTIIQDADLEYNPEEYEKLLAPLISGKSDVVYGSRFMGARRVFMFWHHVGNKLLTFLCNILYNTNLSDLMTCYKIMPTEILKMFDLKSNRFEMEAEITAKVFKSKLRVFEIPITYEGRGYEEGKKTRWLDGIVSMFTLLKYRFWVNSVGEETLRRISRMKKFNWLIYNMIESQLGERVVEAGCGNGNISQYLIHKDLLIGIDIDADFVKKLNEKYSYLDGAKFICSDLQFLDVGEIKKHNPDSIVSINVLEHVDDDEKAIQNFHKILGSNGKIILIVPAMHYLYCNLDKNLGHKRRYDKNQLRHLLEKNGFEIEKINYFNFFGVFGWFFSGHILRNSILPSGQLMIYEYLVPIFKAIEKIIGPPIGLSLFVTAKKKGD